MFCEVCGIENEQGAVFCKNCGSKITIEEDKKYIEAVEQLKYEGFEILNDIKNNRNENNSIIVNSNTNNTNNVNANTGIKNNACNMQPSNNSRPNNINNNIQRNMNRPMDSNYNKKANMGEIVVDSSYPKKKSIVPIVICIAVLALLIIGGIGGLTYYYLFGI